MSAKKTKKKQKKAIQIASKQIGAFIVLLSVVVVWGFVYAFFFCVPDSSVVASVNGYEITAKELEKHMSDNKTYIISHFQTEYDAEVNNDFWNTQYGDTTPNDYLREYTLEQLIRYKVEQQLAVSYGLLDEKETTYESFLQQLEAENGSRKESIASGEVVYGVQSYTESTYFSYIYSNMQLRLQEIMAEEGQPLWVSEQELEAWYEEVKEERYISADNMVFESYSISLQGAEDIEDNNASEYLEQVRKALLNGATQDEIEKQYTEVIYQQVMIDEDNASSMQKSSMVFYEAADALQPGEVSSVLHDNTSYMLLKCISKEKGGYKDFEAYKDGMRMEYIEENYAAYVDELVRQAEVEKKRNYKKVVMK